MTARLQWQYRPRGTFLWRDLPEKPERWYLQEEYRSLRNGTETWRSPHVNGYQEKEA